jgi:hypothetical protein
MTKREAIEILRHADTDSEVDADDYLEAFDMAVSALEHEADIDHYMNDLRQSLTESVKQMMCKLGISIVVEPQRIDTSALDIFYDDEVELTKRENPALKVIPGILPMTESPRKNSVLRILGQRGSSTKEKEQ